MSGNAGASKDFQEFTPTAACIQDIPAAVESFGIHPLPFLNRLLGATEFFRELQPVYRDEIRRRIWNRNGCIASQRGFLAGEAQLSMNNGFVLGSYLHQIVPEPQVNIVDGARQSCLEIGMLLQDLVAQAGVQ